MCEQKAGSELTNVHLNCKIKIFLNIVCKCFMRKDAFNIFLRPKNRVKCLCLRVSANKFLSIFLFLSQTALVLKV